MVARPCRSRTGAYTAEGAHPGLRRCRLVPLPRRGPRQRGSGSNESSPPATPRGSSRLCSHTSGLKLTGTCQRRPGILRPLPHHPVWWPPWANLSGAGCPSFLLLRLLFTECFLFSRCSV